MSIKKLQSYLSAAARLNTSGNADIDHARLLLKSEQWGLALQSIQTGLNKGQLEQPGEAYELLAEVYRKLGKAHLAQQALSDRALCL
ncbi:hypothetical protein HBA55_15855 [Pseudomaricurvus alkylphenolicus]|jgi:predicted Zn-dependent protease|uniref:hypothetical protein n=1 Tax=Pseudomaricurvus alkylphenolicus TaxID=1306991 RepID=UPI001420AD04|nr:hypothetical protein [Pseudomaricurvus alkylphenolicus]NIB41079.1 hypothetical protein [Pseudomaricurvus alkylphenolicus]